MKSVFLLFVVLAKIALTSSAHAGVPQSTSAFEGWQGVKIVYGKRGPDTCDLRFPNEFGYRNGAQLQDLLTIIRGSPTVIKHDFGCMAPPVYYALDQLLKLAVEEQDLKAAHIILRPSFYGGLNLGGELAEGHTLDRKLPVLLKFKQIKSLFVIDPTVGEETIDEVVYDLCSEWGYDPEMIRDTFKGLRENRLQELAAQFKSRCDSAVTNNPEIQRALMGH
jgi:hypothetical protein